MSIAELNFFMKFYFFRPSALSGPGFLTGDGDAAAINFKSQRSTMTGKISLFDLRPAIGLCDAVRGALTWTAGIGNAGSSCGGKGTGS